MQPKINISKARLIIGITAGNIFGIIAACIAFVIFFSDEGTGAQVVMNTLPSIISGLFTGILITAAFTKIVIRDNRYVFKSCLLQCGLLFLLPALIIIYNLLNVSSGETAIQINDIYILLVTLSIATLTFALAYRK